MRLKICFIGRSQPTYLPTLVGNLKSSCKYDLVTVANGILLINFSFEDNRFNRQAALTAANYAIVTTYRNSFHNTIIYVWPTVNGLMFKGVNVCMVTGVQLLYNLNA